MTKKKWRSFEEARSFVRKLGLKNQRAWLDYCKSGEKPADIPADPRLVYSEYKDLGDWLGTGFVAHSKRKWLSFPEARDFARKLGLKNQREWFAYWKSNKRPDDIPANPAATYSPQFKNWGDWLGTGHVHHSNRRFKPFNKAREFARKLGLKNQSEWQDYSTSGKRPDDIPASPAHTYGSEFKGFGDWLGTGAVANQDRQYRPFEEAREFVRGLGLKGQDEWTAYCKSGEKPDDIPADPRHQYSPVFKGYGDWLGIINRWNKYALLAFLNDLRPHLPDLEESELYTILQQGGALPALGTALGKSSPMQVLKDLKHNAGRVLEQAIRDISENEIAMYADDGIVDEGVADRG